MKAAQIHIPTPIRHLWHKFTPARTRLVGGTVRDLCLRKKPYDFDFASQYTPQEILQIAAHHQIPTKTPGLDHGTVMVIAGHQAVEITSLRRDIATDGRHATIAFTQNWQEDAARRDFTINALYQDIEGEIYDYFEGREDLASGKIRFIGAASERLAEDYLRYIRFFRFYAHYGKIPLRPQDIEACRAAALHLQRLSAERIGHEVQRLLQAENPLSAWQAMLAADGAALFPFLPNDILHDQNALARLIKIEKHIQKTGIDRLDIKGGGKTVTQRGLLRLAAILTRPDYVAETAQALRLSKQEQQYLTGLFPQPPLDPAMTKLDFYKLLDTQNAKVLSSLCPHIILAWAQSPAALDDHNWLALYHKAANISLPALPISGRDIMALGVKAGPDIGKLRKQVQQWWWEQDMQPSRAACLAHLTLLVEALPASLKT